MFVGQGDGTGEVFGKDDEIGAISATGNLGGDDGGGLADEEELAEWRTLGDDGVGEGVEGEVLVVAAGDEEDGGVEGVEGTEDGVRVGGDGVVVVEDALEVADELEAMREGLEGLKRGGDDGGIDAEGADDAECGEDVLDIVGADEGGVGKGEGEGTGAVGEVGEGGVGPGAKGGTGGAGEEEDAGGGERLEGAHDGVVEIEDGEVGAGLVTDGDLLGGGVVGHGLVAVEMVGLDVGDNGDLGGEHELAEIIELEGGYFEDDVVGGGDATPFGEEGMADVAAEPGDAAGGFEDVGDEGGGGGLAVGAGDGEDGSGTELEEDVHLGGDGDAGGAGSGELGTIAGDGGGGNDEGGLGEIGTDVAAEDETDGEVADLGEGVLELVGGGAVGDGDVGAEVAEEADGADGAAEGAETHDGDGLALPESGDEGALRSRIGPESLQGGTHFRLRTRLRASRVSRAARRAESFQGDSGSFWWAKMMERAALMRAPCPSRSKAAATSFGPAPWAP